MYLKMYCSLEQILSNERILKLILDVTKIVLHILADLWKGAYSGWISNGSSISKKRIQLFSLIATNA